MSILESANLAVPSGDLLAKQLAMALDVNAVFCIGCGQHDEPELHDATRCPGCGGVLDLLPVANAIKVFDASCEALPDLDEHARALHCAILAAAVYFTPPASDVAVPAGAPVEWRCYHCGDVFTDDRGARLHFGRDEDSIPACQIKAGAEQGLLGALREAEYAAADAQQAVANECTDAAKAYYAQASRHAQALRNAEELGYERGLTDGRALAAAPKVASDTGAEGGFGGE